MTASSEPDIKRELSAGGAVYRRNESQVLWLVQERAGHGYWQIPKGHIETGETAAQAAVREVKEESGITARIIAALAPSEYFYSLNSEKRFKKVDWFLMEYVTGSTDNFDPKEVSSAAFLPYEEARAKIAYDSEKAVLQQARSLIESSDAPPSTRA